MDYIKHLIECNCILPQFKNRIPPLFHKFVVFSVIDDSGNLISTIEECNYCGAIHKILEVGKSQQLAKEESRLVTKIDEVKIQIPENLKNILENYKCELSTWKEVLFVLNHEKWGQRPIILFKENDGNKIVGKYLLILGKNLFKIETFEET